MIFYVIIIVLSLWIYLYLITKNRTEVPSGMKSIPIEKGLPIIGVLHQVREPPCDYACKLSKKHGPIYQVQFGMRTVLILNNFEYMKAALVDNGEAFSGRFQLEHYISQTDHYGILNTESTLWSEQRSFILKALKEFGIGRSRSVEIVQEECIFLLKDLEEMNSKKIHFSDFISLYTANVISKFIMNRRFTHEDPDLKIIEETMKFTADKKDTFAHLCLMLPVLDRNEWLVKVLIWITSRKRIYRDSHKIFEKEIKERSESLDFNASGEDLIERFLIKQHQMKNKGKQIGTFTDGQLKANAFELFSGGYETTSTTLTWGFMFMAMYPEVQEKVHEEICDKIGNERLPTMSDKASLAYTQAVMDEILRLSSVAPLSLPHRTLKDTCVKGYFVPKNTLVMPNLLACHTDPAIWEKPKEFYPEHFLLITEDESFKYKPREELVPFGMGKRQCLGESLARTEYFIFFTGILQRFQVSLANEEADKMDIFKTGTGIIRQSCYRDFTFKKRDVT